ncbi:MAG: metallopeptidase [Oscillospiraceae bacterium]|nr:metallopeptidase [Oscillospiraceae bacterium]
MDEREEKRLQLAREVLKLSRNTLLVHLRFLDMALSRLRPVATDLAELATDGQFLAYDPGFVLRRYKQAKETPVRDYLHVVLHCVFRHMYIHSLLDQPCWDLACDVAVEHTISGLALRAAAAPREAAQQAELQKLEKELKLLTAEKLYRYFLDRQLPPGEMERLRALFSADQHVMWYLPPEQKMQITMQFRVGAGTGSGSLQTGSSSVGAELFRVTKYDHIGPDSGQLTLTAADAEADWADVSQRMQQDLETFSKRQGTEAGNLMQNLAAVNREKYDYTAFLRKFAVLGEVMKINDDEFDYVYYTYGLKLYEKMPLIEPLEYKDVKRIREFVIAIDTSGSTSGALVQRFLQKTYNILQESESFFTKINVHIIQCDADIQDDTKITCREDFDQYLQTMQLRGLGGTDFRPVFAYVDSLIWNKEFQNLKGLIYFTDGCGTFPERKPDYETAFVFIDDDYNNYDVPPWAIKLVLQKEEI